jgi:hypothetical protein
MPNQMIALQSRNPQLPDPARQTAQYANMMNMTKQQEAAERQAALAQQEMGYKAAQEKRAGETQTSNMRKADLEFQESEMKRLARIGVAILETQDPNIREAAYQNLLGLVEKTDQQLGATMRQVAGTFNAPVLRSVIMEVDNYFNKKYATPIAVSAVNARTGQQSSLTLGGTDPRAEVVGEVVPEDTTPTAPQPSAMGREPSATSDAPMTFGPDKTRPLNATQQEDLRRLEAELGMTNSPASFTGMGGAGAAQMTPEVMSRIADSAFQTGVIAQVDFDQLLATQPPENRQAFTDAFRRANITLQPNAPSLADSGMGQQQMAANPVQTPQAGFADLRGPALQLQTAGLRGAPPMEQTMLQSQGRTPFIPRRESPAPGVYQVPTQDVAATSRATRPSKQEVFDTELAKIRAARAAGPAPVTAQQKLARKTELAKAYSKTQTLIDKAYNPREGIISIANKIKLLSRDQKEAITGYSNYVPSFRESTREADTLFGNLKGVVTALGKDVAAASGAISSMAVQEWTIVADMIAKLDLANMTPRALDAQMDRIIEQVSTATKLAERVYDAQYGDDVKEYPAFKLRGTPPARTKTPVAKGGSNLSPDIDKILKSRGI